MNIVLIGTIVKDHIINYDGKESYSFGGLFYSINAFRSILGESDRITPVSAIGEDVHPEVLGILQKDPRIDTTGLQVKNQKSNRVELYYTSPFERIERSLNPLPVLQFSEIGAHLDGADMIVVNMISGWDIDLETFSKIREKFSGIIYLDFHSLTLGREKDGTRYLKFPQDGADWIKMCDILQMNQREFDILNHEQADESRFCMEHCLEQDKIINLTKSEHGSTTYFHLNGKLQGYNAHPPATVQVTDPTGCGDAFAAGFLIHYYANRNIREAAQEANKLAAIFGSYRGMPDPERVREDYLYSRVMKQ